MEKLRVFHTGQNKSSFIITWMGLRTASRAVLSCIMQEERDTSDGAKTSSNLFFCESNTQADSILHIACIRWKSWRMHCCQTPRASDSDSAVKRQRRAKIPKLFESP
jgi:hypothetical protein